jgi:hypothetical protein
VGEARSEAGREERSGDELLADFQGSLLFMFSDGGHISNGASVRV